MTFYLQNVSNGLPLTSANTLDTVTVLLPLDKKLSVLTRLRYADSIGAEQLSPNGFDR